MTMQPCSIEFSRLSVDDLHRLRGLARKGLALVLADYCRSELRQRGVDIEQYDKDALEAAGGVR